MTISKTITATDVVDDGDERFVYLSGNYNDTIHDNILMYNPPGLVHIPAGDDSIVARVQDGTDDDFATSLLDPKGCACVGEIPDGGTGLYARDASGKTACIRILPSGFEFAVQGEVVATLDSSGFTIMGDIKVKGSVAIGPAPMFSLVDAIKMVAAFNAHQHAGPNLPPTTPILPAAIATTDIKHTS
jgi:hypothetical protein